MTVPERREVLRSRWATVLVVAVWAWVVVPRTVQSITAPKYRAAVGTAEIEYSGITKLVVLGLTVVVVLLCLVIVIGSLTDLPRGGFGGVLLMVAPWVYLVVRDLYIGQHPALPSIAYPVVVAAVWVLRMRVRQLAVLGLLVGVTAAISVAIAVVLPNGGLYRSEIGSFITEDKQILPWGTLVGVFSQGNNLGQFMVLGLPLILLIRAKGLRAGLLLVTSLTIVWSASRSSLLAVGLVAVVALVLSTVRPINRAVVGVVACAASFVVVCVLPLITIDPTAFTNRGLIWLASLDWWRAKPWWGNGSNWYADVGRTSARLAGSAFHGHNQLVHLLVTGGLVLAVLVALQLWATAVRAARLATEHQSFGITYLVALAGTCLLEKSLVYVDNTTFFPVVVLPLAVLLVGDREAGPRPARHQHSPAAGQLSRRYSVTIRP